MKKFSSILLLSLMLIPFFWNAKSLIHYLVEHTHTFCASEQDHQHSPTDDCHTICLITTAQHDQAPIPTKTEFHELKQCITAFSSFNTHFLLTNHLSTNANYALLYGRIISEDIFRPPIS